MQLLTLKALAKEIGLQTHYTNGTVEVHIGIKGVLSTYKEFKDA